MTFDTTFDTDGQELVDAREVAARLGFKSARTVLDLRVHRLGFPAPVARRPTWPAPTVSVLSSTSVFAPVALIPTGHAYVVVPRTTPP